MSITVREYGENDIKGMISVWNEVVSDGVAFPQTEELDFVMQAMRFPHRQGEKVSVECLCRIALSVLKNTASKFCSSMLL